jgi:hypothetical protein
LKLRARPRLQAILPFDSGHFSVLYTKLKTNASGL